MVGNIRPSLSVLSFTPRDSNQSTVSLAWKALEEGDQAPRPARVMCRELARIEAGMGDIAAPASRNAHLGQELRPLFEQGKLEAWRSFCACDRRKKTGCPTARHHHTSGTHAAGPIISPAVHWSRGPHPTGVRARLARASPSRASRLSDDASGPLPVGAACFRPKPAASRRARLHWRCLAGRSGRELATARAAGKTECRAQRSKMANYRSLIVHAKPLRKHPKPPQAARLCRHPSEKLRLQMGRAPIGTMPAR